MFVGASWLPTASPQVAASAAPVLAAPADLARLESIAKELAAKGRGAELRDLLDVLAQLGEDAAAQARLRESTVAACAKVKTPASVAALADVARSLRAAAGGASERLAPPPATAPP